ncbi:amidase family protein [Comamonas endophytica]|uniref:Amidase family protein n=1 Tax=Comamonas endophytica TaxID=2949090 RepID=A0ABY6GDR9_9BURK|nr:MULTISPECIES: amidase family protein [unclassified Acidovorax]MCD2512580.1 amidase [Acidovorax sp. D4N7]UYG53058.1 amidase family protein [Acidovorax sp. 5MLIR]
MSLPDSLAALSAQQLLAGYRARAFTPVQVLQDLLAAIGGDAFNAFAFIDTAGALRDAQASAERWQRGAPLGPLDGVPVSIKDLVTVAGWPIRRGSQLSPPQVSAGDAPAVAHLRRSGALLLGKTTTTEMGCAIHADGPVHGRTLHPLAPGRCVGGSSCGAAAQLAAGWGPLALGSDAGGSVRIPGSYAGLAAFKPSFGCIPMGPASAFAEFAHLGPMARSVGDIALAMQVLGQPDARDPASLHARAASVPEEGAALRIGHCLRIGPDAGLDAAIATAMQTLLAQLKGRTWRGRQIELLPIDLGDLWLADALWQTWCARVFEACLHLSAAQIAQLGPDMQRQQAQGQALTGLQLATARRTLREGAQRLHELFAGLDLLLTPSTPGAAPAAGDFVHDAHPDAEALRASGNWLAATPFSHPFNVTQQPALSMPWGHDAQGLPFGLQLAGRRYADALVLDFGAALEQWIKE